MMLVLLAMVPAGFATIWFYGYGALFNVLFAAMLALALEHFILWLRQLPRPNLLLDGSALVTGAIIGLALPSASPWWIAFIATGASMLLGKHLFGGLGYNIFNPAMVGYALVLVSFPLELSQWSVPRQNLITPPGFTASLQLWLGVLPADSITGATPLEIMKFRPGLTLDELKATGNGLGNIGGYASEWVNLAFLAGGLWLLRLRIFTWHAPLGLLAGLVLAAVFSYDGGSSQSSGSPLFHLFSGATMIGAFFIITDPVTGAASGRGRLLMGLLVGVLTFSIRTAGGYPDGIAFAILFMNMVVPAVDLLHTRRGTHDSPNAK